MADGTGPKAGDDLRTALQGAFENSAKEASERAAAEEAERTERAPKPAETADEDIDAVEPVETARETRQRGPDGKFVSTETKDAPAAEAKEAKPEVKTDKPVETKDKPETKDNKEKPTEAKPNDKDPPAHWPAADKEMFKQSTPQQREFLLRRERETQADYTKKTTEIASFKRAYDPVDQLLAPHKDVMRQKGFTEASLITAWFNVEKALMEGKGVEIVKGLVEGYKLDPAAVAAALGIKGTAELVKPVSTDASPGVNGGVDPAKANGHAPIALPPELDNRFRSIEQRFQAEDQARASADLQRVNNSILDFQNQKNDKGELVHPHFQELENDMVLLVEGAKAQRKPVPPLEELYNTAVWANPSTRGKLLEQQRAAEEAQRTAAESKRREEARAKAVAARKASSSITGAPGSGQPPRGREAERGLRDELMANYDDVAAG